MLGQPSTHNLRDVIQRKKKTIKNRLRSKLLTDSERALLRAQLQVLREL